MTIFAVATPDDIAYYDTRQQAENAARNINAAHRCKSSRPQEVADVAVTYAVDVEPDVRPREYWFRDRVEGVAA